MEAAFGCAWRAAQGREVRWFAFTDATTWWHAEGLAEELARAEALLSPASPEADDVLLLGGGGLLTFANFMLLSPAAVRALADDAFVDECRERLVRCDPDERGAGCKFKRHAAPGELYMGNQLVEFCLAPALSSCARPGGCHWLFGSPSSQGRDAAAARRRYVSNAGKRPAQGVLPPLLDLPAAGRAEPCEIRAALRGLVAFGNAGDTMPWLDDLREAGLRCARGG